MTVTNQRRCIIKAKLYSLLITSRNQILPRAGIKDIGSGQQDYGRLCSTRLEQIGQHASCTGYKPKCRTNYGMIGRKRNHYSMSVTQPLLWNQQLPELRHPRITTRSRKPKAFLLSTRQIFSIWKNSRRLLFTKGFRRLNWEKKLKNIFQQSTKPQQPSMIASHIPKRSQGCTPEVILTLTSPTGHLTHNPLTKLAIQTQNFKGKKLQAFVKLELHNHVSHPGDFQLQQSTASSKTRIRGVQRQISAPSTQEQSQTLFRCPTATGSLAYSSARNIMRGSI